MPALTSDTDSDSDTDPQTDSDADSLTDDDAPSATTSITITHVDDNAALTIDIRGAYSS